MPTDGFGLAVDRERQLLIAREVRELHSKSFVSLELDAPQFVNALARRRDVVDDVVSIRRRCEMLLREMLLCEMLLRRDAVFVLGLILIVSESHLLRRNAAIVQRTMWRRDLQRDGTIDDRRRSSIFDDDVRFRQMSPASAALAIITQMGQEIDEQRE
jgi:hypothetical protein